MQIRFIILLVSLSEIAQNDLDFENIWHNKMTSVLKFQKYKSKALILNILFLQTDDISNGYF